MIVVTILLDLRGLTIILTLFCLSMFNYSNATRPLSLLATATLLLSLVTPLVLTAVAAEGEGGETPVDMILEEVPMELPPEAFDNGLNNPEIAESGSNSINSEMPAVSATTYNRFLRWRVNNSLVFAVEQGAAQPGQRVLLQDNRADLPGMKWGYADGVIRGLGDYCLGLADEIGLGNVLQLANCDSLNVAWDFDERGRLVGTMTDGSLGCVEGQNDLDDIELVLTSCNESELQRFELEGVGVTAGFAELEATSVANSASEETGAEEAAEPEVLPELEEEADTAAEDEADSEQIEEIEPEVLPEPEEVVEPTMEEDADLEMVEDIVPEPLPNPEVDDQIEEETSEEDTEEISGDNSENEVEVDELPRMGNGVMQNANVVMVLEEQRFNILLGTVLEAGLAETVMTGENLTVLAPTDEAFMSLPTAVINTLLDPANRDLLREVLSYHVVNGPLTSGDLLAYPQPVPTLAAEAIENPQTLPLGVPTDLIADNNVIVHTLDEVLVPPSIVAALSEAPANETDEETQPDTEDEASSIDPEAQYRMLVDFPTPEVRINGTQSFQFRLIDIDPSEYEGYWQVNGGQLNEMNSTGNGKLAFVDVNPWNWDGTGPYTVTLSAARDGELLAQESVEIIVP